MTVRQGFNVEGDADPEAAFAFAADRGFDFVELNMENGFHRNRIDVDAVRSLAAERDLDLVVHLPYRLDPGSPHGHARDGACRELEAAIDAAADLGAETGVVHATSRADPDDWDHDLLRGGSTTRSAGSATTAASAGSRSSSRTSRNRSSTPGTSPTCSSGPTPPPASIRDTRGSPARTAPPRRPSCGSTATASPTSTSTRAATRVRVTSTFPSASAASTSRPSPTRSVRLGGRVPPPTRCTDSTASSSRWGSGTSTRCSMERNGTREAVSTPTNRRSVDGT